MKDAIYRARIVRPTFGELVGGTAVLLGIVWWLMWLADRALHLARLLVQR